MGLLTPLYLVGLVALSLPIAFHLLKKSIRKEMRFSSLIFLRQTPPRLTRRSRVEHWWLLILRALILTLLIFAFARPLFRSQFSTATQTAAGREILYLVDQSASMQRAALWQSAMDQLRILSSAAAAQDHQNLLVFDQVASVVVDSESLPDLSMAGEAIRTWSIESQPGWDRDDMPAAVQSCLDWLMARTAARQTDRDIGKRPVELHIISDFQSPVSNTWTQIQWPAETEVMMHRISTPTIDNASLMLLAPPRDQEWEGNEASVRITNDRFSKSSVFTLRDASGEKLDEVFVPAGESRVVEIAPQANPTMTWQLDLEGDTEVFDNRVTLPPVASQKVSVACTETSETASQTASWMLEQACRSLKYQEVDWQAFKRLDNRDLSRFHAVFVLRPLDSSELEAVESFLSQGGRVVIGLSEALSPTLGGAWEKVICQLGKWAACSVEEASVEDFTLLSFIDTTRKPLDVFRSSSFRDFTSVFFWKHRNLRVQDSEKQIPEARTLASFDDEMPFLIKRDLNPGTVFIMTAGWTPEQSQLGQNSRFATLMIQLAGLRDLRPPIQFVELGFSINLSENTGTALTQVFDNQGEAIASSVESESFVIRSPGLYRVQNEGTPSFFIAQIPSEEREDARTTPAELGGMGIPKKNSEEETRSQAKVETRLKDQQIESQQQAWRWLLMGVIALVIVETFASGWLSRNRVR